VNSLPVVRLAVRGCTCLPLAFPALCQCGEFQDESVFKAIELQIEQILDASKSIYQPAPMEIQVFRGPAGITTAGKIDAQRSHQITAMEPVVLTKGTEDILARVEIGARDTL